MRFRNFTGSPFIEMVSYLGLRTDKHIPHIFKVFLTFQQVNICRKNAIIHFLHSIFFFSTDYMSSASKHSISNINSFNFSRHSDPDQTPTFKNDKFSSDIKRRKITKVDKLFSSYFVSLNCYLKILFSKDLFFIGKIANVEQFISLSLTKWWIRIQFV